MSMPDNTGHTLNYSLPFPKGKKSVAVHTDIEALAQHIDITLGSELENAIGLIPIQYGDANDLYDKSARYAVLLTTGVAHLPIASRGILEVYAQESLRTVQKFTTTPSSGDAKTYHRIRDNDGSWREWAPTSTPLAIRLYDEDLNDLDQPRIYYQHSTAQAQESRNYPIQRRGTLEVVSGAQDNHIFQTYTSGGSLKAIYIRERYENNWSEWVTVGGVSEGDLGTDDLNSYTSPGEFWQDSPAHATTDNNYPNGASRGYLSVYADSRDDDYVVHMYISPTTGGSWIREKYSGSWTSWAATGSQTTVDFDDDQITDMGMSAIAGNESTTFRGTLNLAVAMELGKLLPLQDIPLQVIAEDDPTTPRPQWQGPVYWIVDSGVDPANKASGDLVIETTSGVI